MMRVQGNTLSGRLDVDMDLYSPLEAKSTTELKVEELDVVIDSFDANCINKSVL